VAAAIGYGVESEELYGISPRSGPRLTSVALTPERLHARYARKIRRHIGAVLGPDDEREDLVQEVLITIFRKVGTLRDPACLDGWVAQVTANTLKYVMRRRRVRRHASWEQVPDRQAPLVQTNLYAREIASRALRVLSRLPPSEHELLMAYWFSPATAESMAAEAGCSIITVRRRLFKAKARFEKLCRLDPELASCLDEARAWTRRSGPISESPDSEVEAPAAE
jgi:RNA polymerase sigma-70 factor (ECF subfamily)